MKKQTKPTLPTIPKLKIKPRKQRTHVPKLPKDNLTVALQNLETLKIPAASKRALGDILRAAANPNSEKIDVVVSSLEPARQKLVKKTARQVREITQDVTSRARKALEDMSDEEWQRLVDESNSGA